MKLQLCLNVTVSMLCAVLLGVSCSNRGAAPTAATSAPTTVALAQLKSESNPLLALAVQRAQPELDLLKAGLVSTKLYGSASKSTSAGPKLGELVRVTVVLEEKDDTLWLPPDAIRTFQGRSFVLLQDRGRQRQVDVDLGIEAQGRVEVLDGLTEGQIVVAP